MKKILFAMLALGATVLTGLSQTAYPVASYSPVTLPIPVTSLAASTTTNFANGWSASQVFTNTSVTYSQSAGAFVTNTVLTTNTTTSFAQFYCGNQKDVGIQVNVQGSTNVVLTLASSILPNQPNTLNNFTWTISTGNLAATNAAGYYIGTTNIPESVIAGLGYLQIVAIQNADANHAITNLAIYPAVEKNAP